MENRTADTILNDKAFDCMDKNTKEAFKRLYVSIHGKSIQESLPEVISFAKCLPKNTNFTKEQKMAMFNVLFENTPERERRQIMGLISLLGM